MSFALGHGIGYCDLFARIPVSHRMFKMAVQHGLRERNECTVAMRYAAAREATEYEAGAHFQHPVMSAARGSLGPASLPQSLYAPWECVRRRQARRRDVLLR